MNDQLKPKLSLTLAMTIFGTIGLFVRHIDLPSSVISTVRGIVGAAFLYIFTLITKKRISQASIKRNIILLCISGMFIGINWILLFEAYRYTTVATATLCYYLAPVFVILVSPLVLKERITAKKLICAFAALLGMVFVSGVLDVGFNFSELTGVILGLCAAVLYAAAVIMNKKMRDIASFDMTVVQLAIAGTVLLPYTLITEDMNVFAGLPAVSYILLAVLAIVHTGFAYALYFGSIRNVSAQTAAIFSYFDPVVAILLSALVLKEPMTPLSIVGAVLILGSTLISEINLKKKA